MKLKIYVDSISSSSFQSYTYFIYPKGMAETTERPHHILYASDYLEEVIVSFQELGLTVFRREVEKAPRFIHRSTQSFPVRKPVKNRAFHYHLSIAKLSVLHVLLPDPVNDMQHREHCRSSVSLTQPHGLYKFTESLSVFNGFSRPPIFAQESRGFIRGKHQHLHYQREFVLPENLEAVWPRLKYRVIARP